MTKDLKELVRSLGQQGFKVRATRRGHLAVTLSDQTVAVLACTPSDWRSHKNGMARLRRAGFVYPHSV